MLLKANRTFLFKVQLDFFPQEKLSSFLCMCVCVCVLPCCQSFPGGKRIYVGLSSDTSCQILWNTKLLIGPALGFLPRRETVMSGLLLCSQSAIHSCLLLSWQDSVISHHAMALAHRKRSSRTNDLWNAPFVFPVYANISLLRFLASYEPDVIKHLCGNILLLPACFHWVKQHGQQTGHQHRCGALQQERDQGQKHHLLSLGDPASLKSVQWNSEHLVI